MLVSSCDQVTRRNVLPMGTNHCQWQALAPGLSKNNAWEGAGVGRGGWEGVGNKRHLSDQL